MPLVDAVIFTRSRSLSDNRELHPNLYLNLSCYSAPLRYTSLLSRSSFTAASFIHAIDRIFSSELVNMEPPGLSFFFFLFDLINGLQRESSRPELTLKLLRVESIISLVQQAEFLPSIFRDADRYVPSMELFMISPAHEKRLMHYILSLRACLTDVLLNEPASLLR